VVNAQTIHVSLPDRLDIASWAEWGTMREVDAHLQIQRGVSLAAHTSLGLGGEAEAYVEVRSRDALTAALRYAGERGMPTLLLGGGSNLVIADSGFSGLVIALHMRGVEIQRGQEGALLFAQAGEPWDALVALSVRENLAGLECLSGIPGLAGATPVQNVGAYGVEVSQRLERITVLDRTSLEERVMTPEACQFGYRDSLFKREPERFVVLSVTFSLVPDGAPTLRYRELAQCFEDEAPTLQRVREEVLRLRRGKSMVLDEADPDSRSAGSFFTNPIVDRATLAQVERRALDAGVVADAHDMPRFELADGQVKLAAGWLIERAGVEKGTRRGAVGVSVHHALALVHHGGGRTEDLLALAREVRAKVQACFGVTLVAEPVMVGFDAPPL